MAKEISQVDIWRRRLAETEAALTAYVAERGDGQALDAFLEVKATFLAKLPADDHDVAGWKRAFFAGQAAMERFVVYRFGQAAIPEFAERVGQVYGKVANPAGAPEVMARIRAQAECYGSQVEMRVSGPDRGELDITHCAIWDYREEARANGVELTLESPCSYCTHLLTGMMSASGLAASAELTRDAAGHGCRWRATAGGPR